MIFQVQILHRETGQPLEGKPVYMVERNIFGGTKYLMGYIGNGWYYCYANKTIGKIHVYYGCDKVNYGAYRTGTTLLVP